MPKRVADKTLTAVEMLRQLNAGLKSQVDSPNIFAYKPHEKQELFHKAEQRKKLYIGGNRSGKTTGAVVEDIWWLTGTHPYRKIPEGQIRGRVVATSFIDGVSTIIIPQFKQWMPPSFLKNGSWDDSFNRELRTLTLTNGNFVEFRSYDQETQKFAGTSRHFVHYDEEPPEHIFDECNARLVDTAGSFWISMTPLDGMTWVYDKLYVPGTEGEDPKIFVVEADMLDNPHISKEAAEDFLEGLDADDRRAREHGQFVQLGGKVYKHFSVDTHVIPFDSINLNEMMDWEWYISLDHGFNNPTAVLWHAVSPDNQAITFAEHYASEMLIEDHAKVIHERNAGFKKIPEFWIADPALAQRQAVTGTSIFTEYADRGCYFAPGNNDVPTGVARVNSYMRENPATGKPRWLITDNCVHLIKELPRLRWKTYASKAMNHDNNKQEQIHKKNDHASDAARYFFSFMPDLTPQELGSPVSEEGKFQLPAVTGVNPRKDSIDTVLQKMLQGNRQTNWKTTQTTDLSALEYE